MFEIQNGSDMDIMLAKMEKAIYAIRNCVEEASEVEWQISTHRDAIDGLEVALETEIDSY